MRPVDQRALRNVVGPYGYQPGVQTLPLSARPRHTPCQRHAKPAKWDTASRSGADVRPPCLRARGSVLAGYYDCSTPNDACHGLWMPRTAARRHNTARRQLHRNISDRHAGGGEFPNYGFYLAGLPVRARLRETGSAGWCQSAYRRGFLTIGLAPCFSKTATGDVRGPCCFFARGRSACRRDEVFFPPGPGTTILHTSKSSRSRHSLILLPICDTKPGIALGDTKREAGAAARSFGRCANRGVAPVDI
jgi:hypothetical protein